MIAKVEYTVDLALQQLDLPKQNRKKDEII
jgi:hypothetical protein